MSKVYFTKDITPESLIKIYEALGVELTGKVGVKVSTGEKGAKGYLKAYNSLIYFENKRIKVHNKKIIYYKKRKN